LFSEISLKGCDDLAFMAMCNISRGVNVWRRLLTQVHLEYPDSIRLYEPATLAQVHQAEQLLKITFVDLDQDWSGLFQLTNGASVLGYSLAGAMNSRIVDLAEVSTEIRDLGPYRWVREHFVRFLVDASPMSIGFVREGDRGRCMAFLSELTDTSVLPIASSFNVFMMSFLEDVQQVLRSWTPVPGEEWPYGISDIWPLDLGSWCHRDPQLRAMLRKGTLDDLFRHNEEYAAIVEGVLADAG
jgi:hypothetical protein